MFINTRAFQPFIQPDRTETGLQQYMCRSCARLRFPQCPFSGTWTNAVPIKFARKYEQCCSAGPYKVCHAPRRSMTTTEEVKEAGLRWQQHAKAEPGDDAAYLAILTDPPGAEGGPSAQALLGEGPQPPPPANPLNPKKHVGTPPPSGKGEAPSAVALHGGADVTGRYPSRRATLKRRKSSLLALHLLQWLVCGPAVLQKNVATHSDWWQRGRSKVHVQQCCMECILSSLQFHGTSSEPKKASDPETFYRAPTRNKTCVASSVTATRQTCAQCSTQHA